ncbi:hypothetical protein Hanom_Chr12g01138111 [Helianthus anomalus]
MFKIFVFRVPVKPAKTRLAIFTTIKHETNPKSYHHHNSNIQRLDSHSQLL